MISRSVILASAVFAVLTCSAFASPRVGEAHSTSSDILDALSNYVQRNDVSLDLPVADSKLTISARNLQNDEVDFKVKFNNGVVESRKSKLKKVAIPILTFILLKIITLVPLGLGILGIKAFNALQLSFFSFVISVGLAVFQLCRKFADQHPTTIAAGPWDTRSFAQEVNEPAQNIAYNAYL
ncbi:uncharacterized protein LOC129566848 [Sitodiplosis mosellana]|uniref:uncharacterized protein LOC129566848 n=1 Tax=Sitodiplosis mosellana TaxID=263140 RepID=UPI0024438E89|nr:uncharacterized protein LOC129566848 [Sitodiplosis mosellana]